MKLTTTQSWLAATCLLASSATAIGPQGGPGRAPGKPAKMDNWKWANPFKTDSYENKSFTPSCTAEKEFEASEFLLDDLSEAPPLGIGPFRDGLKKVFSDREYPGSWDGIDPHGYDRNLLMMDYSQVPVAVKEWIETQERDEKSKHRGLFAVFMKPTEEGIRIKDTVTFPPEGEEGGSSEEIRAQDADRVVLFAPGALYEVLPLWVAEGSECQDSLLDISKYSPKLDDGAVVAYPVKKTRANRYQDLRMMHFTIKAEVLKANPAAAKEEKKTEEKVEENKKDEL